MGQSLVLKLDDEVFGTVVILDFPHYPSCDLKVCPVVLAYLSARERILSEHGLLDAEPLLCRKDDPARFYSANRLQKVKAQVEAVSGVRFELRALRRTYGQMLLDGGGDLETASGALGHNSLKTTQKYYCQRSTDAVNREILRIMDGSMPASPGTKNPVISRSDDYTGYA
ncbi:MAG: site-specific integrase [Thermoplasmata archaeon]|nr:site-specific integrase [Thermoplasmata archaeon]